MSINPALREAVTRYNTAEKEYTEAKTKVADLLEIAVKTQSPTLLAEFTKINRSTIYWLIRVWSTNANQNGNLRRKES